MAEIIALTIIAILCTGASILSYRFPWWRRNVALSHPRILCYHMVADRSRADRAPRLGVSPAQFERQVRHLYENGWRFVTVSELFLGGINEKTVAITFDDGYADNLTEAAPILARYQASATVYVIADRHEPLSQGGYPDGQPFAPLLTDQQLLELRDTGVFEIGSHTVSHRNLPAADAVTVERELADSKRHLEALLGGTIGAFAYPFGAHNTEVSAAVADTGYQHAVTGGGISTDLQRDRFQVKRIRISGKDTFWNFLIKLRIGRKR